jgi:type IV pilus assembly protein PilC
MINAGLPLVQSLTILAEQSENPRFREVITAVLNDIQAGQTLADSMRRHPKVFTDLYVNMVAAGETGGILDIILKRLSEYNEKQAKLKAQVRSAMIYPIAVMSIAVIVVFVILW